MAQTLNNRYWLFPWFFLLVMVLAMDATAKPAPGDIQFERQGIDASEITAFPPSIFQHWRHRINYRCDACHDSLFKMELGTTIITMERMKKGEVCGTCHNGKVAFPATFQNCGRCHVSDDG